MEETSISRQLRRHEIPGRVKFATGNGGLAKVVVTTNVSTADIYLHGAHVTGFRKNGGPPLLFLSRLSRFAPGEPIRGGVPVCFPWFGSREGDVAHGFARVSEWELTKTSAAEDGAVTLNFRLPEISGRVTWKNLRVEFIVAVSGSLTMELIAANDSPAAKEMENCLHAYFHVGDIGGVKIRGLQGARFLDKTDQGAEKLETCAALSIIAETNRIYHDTPGTMEIVDPNFNRIIRIKKSGSKDTVVWNPWTTQLMPDFDPAEHQNMVCVESGNVGRNKITLMPGNTSTLRVELGYVPFQ
jgi:glucose-6-phosphate 1-epimerase